MAGVASFIGPLRHRDFRLLLAGQTISWIGNNFYEVAIMWLVLKLTGSTAAMGGVAAISALPQLLFGPIAGVYADRLNRRVLALSMDILRGLTVLLLPTLQLLHHLAVWHVYVVAFVLFTMFTFFLPARQSMVPNLVSDEELPAANGMFQATLYISFLLGFGLGGLIVSSLGVTAALYLDALSFAGSALSLLAIHSSGMAEKAKSIQKSAYREAIAGLAFIRRQPALLTILTFNGVVGLLVGPLLILPAPFSRNILHAGAQGYGLLEASFMAGSVVGALGSALTVRIRQVGWLIIAVVAAAGALLVGFSYMHLLAPAMAFNIAIGGVVGLVEVPIMTLIQRLTPDDVRGRVTSTLMLVNTAGTPLSVAVGGVLAQGIGVAAVYRYDGIAFVVIGLASIVTPMVKLRSVPPVSDPILAEPAAS